MRRDQPGAAEGRKMKNRRWTTALCMSVSTLALLTLPAPATAQSQSQTQTVAQNFDIPAQPADNALDVFVRQTRFQVVFTPTAVRDVTTNAVRGTMTPRAALDMMLRGTGLQIVETPGGGTAIRPTQAAGAGIANATTVEDVVVTGTRLSPVFAGASPVQVIDAEDARASGLLDTGTILRNSPQVQGPRSQLRYNATSSAGAATREGPGAQTIGLRGFNPEQTLVLLNGRRMVSAGTEGVPASPDIGLIPQILVNRYEILTEGGSPTYGSDAIAGIVNVQLREDFEGLTAYSALSQPTNGGLENISAASWGKTSSRGYVGIGAEYRFSEGMKVEDAFQFGLDCTSQYTRGPNGEIRTLDIIQSLLPGTSPSSCNPIFSNRFNGRLITNSGIEYWSTPGVTNVGVPGFSVGPIPLGPEFRLDGFNPTPYDADGDGVIDPLLDSAFLDPDRDGEVGFDRNSPLYDTTRGPVGRGADFVAPVDQFSLFAYGKRDFNILGNASIFFEASYNYRNSDSRSVGTNTNPQFFGNGVVPDTNPTNPCGIETPDCISLVDEFDDDGNPVGSYYTTGIPQLVGVFFQVQGDNDRVSSTINQFRLAGGIDGDLPFLNGLGPQWLNMSDWKYSGSAVLSRSEGRSSRQGILRDRIELSLASTVRDPTTGELVCGFDTDGDGIPDPTTPAAGAPRELSDCVPVNLFTPNATLGRKLTAIEEDYVFGNLRYRTDIDLAVFTGSVQGNIGKLPAGPINLVLGGEVRRDGVDVTSTPEGAASNFLTYYAPIPGGAQGSRKLIEGFAEIGVPLIRDIPLIHRLDVSMAARYVNDEFADSASVYTARARWDVTDWFALRATYGTAYRSPGLVELFQIPNVQEGPLQDLCIVPREAVRPDGSYDPTGDFRIPLSLDRCRNQGVDPTTFGADITELPLTRVSQGGTTTALRPETSKSFTAGFVAQVPLTKIFGDRLSQTGLALSSTYYELEVEDIITLGGLGTVYTECYLRPEGEELCDRIIRGDDGFIDEVKIDFVNQNGRLTRGIDFNALFTQTLDIGSSRARLSLNLSGNYDLENVFARTSGSRDVSGEPEWPKLRAALTAQAAFNNISLTWFANYTGSAELSPDRRPEQQQIRTCLPAERSQCSFIDTVDGSLIHNASLAWQPGRWAAFIGVNNVLNTPPPRVNAFTSDAAITNTLLNGNYSLSGRTFVFQLRRAF